MGFYSVLVEVGPYLVAMSTPYDGLTTGQFIATGDSELGYVKNNLIFSLDINTGTWSRQDMAAPDGDDETMFQAKVLRINNDILNGIIRTGGTNFAKSTNVSTFMSLGDGSEEWDTFPPLTTPRFAHAMLAINETVMVFG